MQRPIAELATSLCAELMMKVAATVNGYDYFITPQARRLPALPAGCVR